MSQVVIDCPEGPWPMRRVAGMSLLERHVREARRAGAQRIVVRGPASLAAATAALGVERLEPGAALPADAALVPGDELSGIRITDERSRRRAEWALLQTCRRPYDGPGDRMTRSISLRMTRVIARTPITPNQITLVSVALGLAACALVARGDRGSLAVAGALVFASLMFDSVDGELARIRHLGSKLGMWLDNLADDLVDTLLIVAMGVGVGGVWLPIALGGAAARIVSALTIYAGAARLGHPGDVMAFRWWFESGEATEAVYENPLTPLTLLRSFGRRDLYVIVFALCFAAGWPLGALLLALANAAAHFALSVLHLALRHR